ncbi:hypothetical protein [Streptomyces sp. NPDC049879]|uniref:hypothetical protein n=1 Tax=Streptomyces sp. NPDC049879 TaxID=3365598 RepID=UPI003789477B
MDEVEAAGAGEDAAPVLRPGLLAVDDQGRVGRVMAVEAGAVFLRPPGGGCEWDVAADRVRPVLGSGGDGRLMARLRELNAYSRWARSWDGRG